MKQFATICTESLSSPKTCQAHQLPIFATAAFTFQSLEEGIEVFSNQPGSYVYSRYGNPTVEAVAQKIADLEVFGTQHKKSYGLITSSGMSAIYLALESCLAPGDSILTQRILYGGTTELMNKVFKKNGIHILNDSFEDYKLLEERIKSNPSLKLIYVESPVNPTLTCIDLEKVGRLARKYSLKFVVDNTFATPFLCRPFNYSADIIVHSTTKYLHGHGVSTGGAIICWDQKLMHDKIWTNYKLVGTNASPFEAWLIDIGLKTLPLRMEKHCFNAMQLAIWLEKHPKILKVNYPGLKSHVSYKIAKKQMNLFGAMLSIEIDGSLNKVNKILNALTLCKMAPTLGETDTLILHPSTMSHLKIPKDIREQQGIKDNLVRISVGIESIEDIIMDWDRALK